MPPLSAKRINLSIWVNQPSLLQTVNRSLIAGRSTTTKCLHKGKIASKLHLQPHFLTTLQEKQFWGSHKYTRMRQMNGIHSLVRTFISWQISNEEDVSKFNEKDTNASNKEKYQKNTAGKRKATSICVMIAPSLQAKSGLLPDLKYLDILHYTWLAITS